MGYGHMDQVLAQFNSDRFMGLEFLSTPLKAMNSMVKGVKMDAMLRQSADREVKVNKEQLLAELQKNRDKHLTTYNTALANYKSQLSAKIKEEFANARRKLQTGEAEQLARVDNLTDEDILKQRDTLVIVQAVAVSMPVPRNYVSEYDKAIAMVQWDIRPELLITGAQFDCFILNQWGWTDDFRSTTMSYCP